MPRKYVKVTRARLKQAILLLYEGKSHAAIAKEIGCSKNALYNWFEQLRKRGVEVPRTKGEREFAASVFDDIAKQAKGETTDAEEEETENS